MSAGLSQHQALPSQAHLLLSTPLPPPPSSAGKHAPAHADGDPQLNLSHHQQLGIPAALCSNSSPERTANHRERWGRAGGRRICCYFYPLVPNTESWVSSCSPSRGEQLFMFLRRNNVEERNAGKMASASSVYTTVWV